MYALRASRLRAAGVFAVAAALATLAAVSPPLASAMGQAPSTCGNSYDSLIVSSMINNGTQTVNPMSPNATFYATKTDGYNITVVLHTANESTNGNRLNGTTWYSTFAPGFALGVCVYDVYPNETLVVNYQASYPATFNPAASPVPQQVGWQTWNDSEPSALMSYNVIWVNQSSSQVASTASTGLGTTASTSTTAGAGPVAGSTSATGTSTSVSSQNVSNGAPLTGFSADYLLALPVGAIAAIALWTSFLRMRPHRTGSQARRSG
jgi:hypothetical protein